MGILQFDGKKTLLPKKPKETREHEELSDLDGIFSDGQETSWEEDFWNAVAPPPSPAQVILNTQELKRFWRWMSS